MGEIPCSLQNPLPRREGAGGRPPAEASTICPRSGSDGRAEDPYRAGVAAGVADGVAAGGAGAAGAVEAGVTSNSAMPSPLRT